MGSLESLCGAFYSLSHCFRLVFQSLKALNCLGFSGDNYMAGVPIKEIKLRLIPTPYELYGWQSIFKKDSGVKRGRDGAERRSLVSMFDIVSLVDAIVIAEAVVDAPDGSGRDWHAIVWDGWRNLMFIGPGRHADDRSSDGMIKVDKLDQVCAHRFWRSLPTYCHYLHMLANPNVSGGSDARGSHIR